MIRALVILLPAIVVLGLGYLAGWAVYRVRSRRLQERSDAYKDEARRQRDRANARAKTLNRVRELAETNAGIDPILSAQILAEITPTERHPQ